MSHYPRRLLPLVAPYIKGDQKAAPEPDKLGSQSTKLRILLLEDSPTQAAVLTNRIFHSLSMSQLAILRVPTLAEARTLVLAPPPDEKESAATSFIHNPNLGLVAPLAFDLIILDVRLPDGSGYELCRELKANRSTAAVPVVMFSESPLAVLGGAALEAGANYCISKDQTGGDQTLVMLITQLLVERNHSQHQTSLNKTSQVL
jgi:CheY-like chemotaxis protein